MTINFEFQDRVDKRSAGSEVLHYNELHTVAASVPYGTFTTNYIPLDIASPDARRITVRVTPADTGTLLTETLILTNVVSGSLLFYCDFSTGLVSVDPDLIGGDVYATYNGPDSAFVGIEYVVPAADSDGLCRILLLEVPLEFTLISTDTRKIYITSTGHGDLIETKALPEVISNPLKYNVEFDVGRITFNSAMVNDHIFIDYYGSGSVVWAEDVRECHEAFVRLDQSALHTDGSNPMIGDLDIGGNSISNVGSGMIDGIQLATHNHEGGTDECIQLDGQHAIIINTIQSGNLQNKTISGPGAVATGNIQNNSVTNSELVSDKDSLNKVSGAVMVIGGAADETIGVNTTPDPASTAEIVFRTQAGVASDKLLLHESGGPDGSSGVNIDSNSELNIYSLKNKNIVFRTETSTGTVQLTIDNITGNVTVKNNVNAIYGKLKEGSPAYPIFPAGFTTAFYQTTQPPGWSKLTVFPGGAVPITGHALRITSAISSHSDAGLDMVSWLQNHTHTYNHTHSFGVWSGTVANGWAWAVDTDVDYRDNAVDVVSNVHSHQHAYSGNLSTASVSTSGPSLMVSYADVILASKD